VNGRQTITVDRDPWAVVAVVGSLGCLVGGILWPGMAETLLRILLVSLALGWAAARALKIGLPSAKVYDTFSPFDGMLADAPAPAVPDVVQRRARTVTAVDDPHGGVLRPIPWPVAQALIREIVRRLESGWGMLVDRPDDVDRIRRRVSESTWTLLGLGEVANTPTTGGMKGWMVPLARLDDILDDLERL
jgi:hypothetical protein